MKSKDLQKEYIERLNDLLQPIDFKKLDVSCNLADDSYTKDILKRMHDSFIEVYKNDYPDDFTYEFVEVPAGIRGRNTEHIRLGIVSLDLGSSGEHWGTFFLTPKGVIEQGDKKQSVSDTKYLEQTYIPYDYWYTVSLERDHHVNFNNVPENIADMLDVCQPNQLEMKME